MSKTLGQIAYEAHTPDWHVSFDGLREQYQQAWQAAAEAVAAEVTHRDRPLDGIDNVLSTKPMFMRAVYEGALTHAESERLWAVIEAARKVKRLQLDKSDGWTASEQELVLALEALDSEEE